MRNLWTVFRFEFMDIVKKKTSTIVTIILVLIALVASLSPMLFASSEEEPVESEVPTNLEFGDVGFYLNLDEENTNYLVNTLNLDSNQVFASSEDLRNAITSEEYWIGFEVNSLTSFNTIYFNRSGYGYTENVFQSVLYNLYRSQQYSELGIDPQAIVAIENTPIANEVIILGRDSMSNYMVTYVLSFAIYFVVLLYGQSVATAVAREKDSRTMELLITSTKPTFLIVGKVLAVMTYSIIQVSLVVLAGLIGFEVAKSAYPADLLIVFENSFTWDMILITLYFFLMGYALYMFIYAALGSLVSRMEDVSSAVMPITFIGMIAFFIAMMSIGDLDGIINRVASIIPFTSFITMPTRYLLTVVPTVDMVLSMVLLLATTVFFAYLTIKIYRWGTLHYGNKVSFFKAAREVNKR